MNPNNPTVLDDYTALVEELPYWLREVYGKHVIGRVRDFIVERGGGKQPEIKSKRKLS